MDTICGDSKGGLGTDIELHGQHHACPYILELALQVGILEGQRVSAVGERGHRVVCGLQLVPITIHDRFHFTGSSQCDGGLDIIRLVQVVFFLYREEPGRVTF